MTLLLLAVATAIISVYIYTKLSIPKELRHIPSKYAFNWLKSILFKEHFEEKVDRVLKQYKESSVQLEWTLGKYTVRVYSVEATKLLFDDIKTFPKQDPFKENPNRLFIKFFGDSVAFSSHETWRKHRKVVNPIFKHQIKVKAFVDTTRQFFSLLDNKPNCFDLEDVHMYMRRITMDCLGKDVMGVEFNSIINPDVEFLNNYNSVIDACFKPFYFLVPVLDTESNPFRKPAFQQLRSIRKYFKNIVNEKREFLKSNQVKDSDLDLLSLLVKASEDKDNNFSELDIQYNITTFLTAGHESTAFALSVALHLLATHPEIQEKARKEVMEVMNYSYNDLNANEAIAPTLEQTKNMNYLLAVIKETMRLYPPSPRVLDRDVTEDVLIDGILVPKGASVTLDIYCTQRDPNSFKEPNKFVPERFLEGKDSAAFNPFGGGTRFCLGSNFSLLEMKVVLSMILSRYRLKNSFLDFSFKLLIVPNSSSIQFVPLNKVK